MYGHQCSWCFAWPVATCPEWHSWILMEEACTQTDIVSMDIAALPTTWHHGFGPILSLIWTRKRWEYSGVTFRSSHLFSVGTNHPREEFLDLWGSSLGSVRRVGSWAFGAILASRFCSCTIWIDFLPVLLPFLSLFLTPSFLSSAPPHVRELNLFKPCLRKNETCPQKSLKSCVALCLHTSVTSSHTTLPIVRMLMDYESCLHYDTNSRYFCRDSKLSFFLFFCFISV